MVSACRKGSAGQRLRLFGALWFFLAYLPISNIARPERHAAEHWLYLPSVGFLIFLAGCALDFPPRQRARTRGLACLAVDRLRYPERRQKQRLGNAETFYERTIAAGGGSDAAGLLNLVLIYSGRGEDAKAETMFRQLLRLYPDIRVARNNLAERSRSRGKQRKAEAIFAASNVRPSKSAKIIRAPGSRQ